mmetsp:Transcript_12580/g.41793  ORF Transcript_12580/g.41793 Transcript_12580/m.41793 type:complete len:214 (-) Transcript_12580:792-1433(-)
MVIVAAWVWCPAAMMSFMSPQSSSSVYALSPVSGSVRKSMVSSKQTCSISPPFSRVAVCCARRFLTISSPIFSKSSYAAVSSRNRPIPSFAPSSNRGNGVINTSPMISALRWYASSMGLGLNFCSAPVITSRLFCNNSKLWSNEIGEMISRSKCWLCKSTSVTMYGVSAVLPCPAAFKTSASLAISQLSHKCCTRDSTTVENVLRKLLLMKGF